MSASREIRQLARIVTEHSKQIRGLSGGPQLAHSTIEDGAIKDRDADGTLRTVIGRQHDGTHTIRHVDGPVPPQPTAPAVEVDGPVLRVAWDGQFAAGEPTPEDFSRVDVHITAAGRDTVAGNLGTREGSAVVLKAQTSGEHTVTLVARSLSGKSSTHSEAVVVDVTVVSFSGAIEAVQLSANGKNQVTYATAPPTTEDAGTEGDTWWVNEARLRDPDDPESEEYIAIVEQWRHDGTAWVAVELAHEVIASVDLGTATVGYLHGQRIVAGTVDAEQLRANAIDGMIITGATVQTAPSGARVSLDGSALSVYDHEDDWRVRLSPEGSTFKGDLEAESLVTNGPAEFKSTENMLASGARLTLASGVTDPTAPPVVQPYWDERITGLPKGGDFYGLAFADGKYWTYPDAPMYWTYQDAPQTTEGDALVSIDPTTGQLVDPIPMTDGFWAAYGVTAIGSRLYLLGKKDSVPYKAFVRVYETTGVFVREWEYTGIGHSPTNPLRFKPGIGTDGTNVVIAQCTDAGSLVWRIFNKDTGAIISTVNCQDNTASDIRGVYIGPSDLGGTYTTVVKASNGMNATFTTSGTHDRDKSWFAETKKHTGLVFVDGHFRSLAPSGKITRFEGQDTGDDSPDWWAAYRWETDIDGDNQLDYRSRISPPARFTWPRRARLKAIGAPLPVGVLGIGGFTAKKATRPTRQDFRRTLTHFRAGQPVALWHQYTGAGSTPSDENTFPLADPAIIRSASASFEVQGDGSGQWGPLVFTPTGGVTGVGTVVSGNVDQPNVAPDGGNVGTIVTFPAGRFTTPPTVVAASSNGRIHASSLNVTTTNFLLRSWNFTTATAVTNRVSWIAVEG